MSIHLKKLMNSKHILLLQGPMGHFFSEFAQWLQHNQIEVTKVNFNGGDWCFSRGLENVHFRGKLSQFDNWLKKIIHKKQIQAIVCFGDCRFYHRIAKRVCTEQKVDFFVFEEGYIRPNYLTFEENGVNNFSLFKKFYDQSQQDLPDIPLPDNPSESFPDFKCLIRSAIIYYLMWVLMWVVYPHYRHHRMITPFLEVFYWIRAAYRRLWNGYHEPYKFLNLIQYQSGQYFIVALQVHNDSQVRVHSNYADVRDFIEEVMTSFAQFSDPSIHVVFKHHPMDRGYRHYGQLISQLAEQHGIFDRVHYMCDVHLPTLMKHSLGVVTINSTTGIQALHHGKPVIALGRAIYKLSKLSYEGTLNEFWSNPGRVNRLHYRRFRYALVYYSQLNGAYYGQSPWMQNYNAQMQLSTRYIDNIIETK